MHFLELRVLYFDSNFTDVYLMMVQLGALFLQWLSDVRQQAITPANIVKDL